MPQPGPQVLPDTAEDPPPHSVIFSLIIEMNRHPQLIDAPNGHKHTKGPLGDTAVGVHDVVLGWCLPGPPWWRAFTSSFFRFIAEQSITCERYTPVSFGEGGAGFWIRGAHFWRPQKDRNEIHGGHHAISAWTLCCSWLISRHKKMKWDWGWPSSGHPETVALFMSYTIWGAWKGPRPYRYYFCTFTLISVQDSPFWKRISFGVRYSKLNT